MKKMAKLYNQDGSGRDSYIFFNNGGFYPPEKRLFSKSPEINWGYGSPVHQKSAFQLSKRQFYFSDGTGRDTYVVSHIPDKVTFQPEFPTQLRHYNSQVVSPRYPYKLPPLKQAQLNQLAHSQSRLNESLSIPKYRKEKKPTAKHITLGDL